MSRRHEHNEAGMSNLIAEVFAGDEPASELMVRYARDPDSLSAGELREVETFLEAHPSASDGVSVLQQFELPPREDVPVEPDRTEADLAVTQSPWQQLLEWAVGWPARRWVPALAMAAFAAVFVVTGLGGPKEIEAPSYRKTSLAAARPAGTLRPRGALITELRALAPNHVARASKASPTLIWWVDPIPNTLAILELTVAAEAEAEPPIVRPVVLPTVSGLQQLDLAALEIVLTERETYRWSISLRQESDDPSATLVANGWVEYVSAGPELAEAVAVEEEARLPALYAEQGYWYDAVSVLATVLQRDSTREDASAALASLLEQGGAEPLR
ncbi:MAG: DUF928 domain-containing protein [Deltaproteobacteria bacterium]|nr:DUF928 domain-containing protein [Deltaproteobacteria bacterium]MBW2389936.1 DUF928 domain-containing protein [Deltaproteobacteria bacterium]MBW2724089.1 DUF928 domain-containing protein [Deltaproteobacteria bacterium]